MNTPRVKGFSVTHIRQIYKNDKVKLVGALLDYGYTKGQITEMTGLGYREVVDIIRHNGFKDAAEQMDEPSSKEGQV